MKIKKYDSGGMAIYTPVMLPPQSQTTTSGATTSSSTSDKKDDEWEIKKVMEMIQKNGLISDVNVTMDELKSFYTTAKSLSSNYLFGGDQSYDILAHMFDVQKEINANVVNYDSWKTAQQNAYNQGALGEVATTAGGNIYVWTEKGITSVSPEEYSKNKGTGVYYDFNEDGSDYLTNDELLVIRKDLVPGNPYLISSVNSAKGMETIRKEIRTIVKDFEAKDRHEYVKREGKNVTQSTWNGMQILIGEGPDGYYKASTKSELGDINSALEYLWESIGQVGRNKLIAEVAVSGGDPTKEEDVFRLILNALDKHTAYSQDVNFEKTATEYDPDGDGKGDAKTESLERLAAFAMGKGEVEEIWIVPRASEIGQRGAGRVKAMNFGNMVDKNDNTLPIMSVASLRSQAEYFKAAFNQDVTFGGQIVNGADENAILWDGTSQVAQVWLPYTRTENGQITPDFDLFFRYMDFVNELDDNPNRPPTEINKLVTKYKLNGKLNPDNILELADTMCFMTFSAYAHDDAINFTDATKRMTEEVSRQEGSRIAQIYENASRYGTTTPGKNHKTLYNFDTMQFWDKNDFRKGNVFIPIKSSFLGTYASMKELVPESMVNNFHHRATLANGQPVVSGQFKE